MRFVFMDEAGTSGAEHEKCRIVASVIVDADEQLMRAERLLDEALGAVPPEFRKGFIFHAKEIMENKKYGHKDRWRLTDRLKLVETVMAIPSKLNMPICFGLTWPDTPCQEEIPFFEDRHLVDFEIQHLWSFFYCLVCSDAWIRNYAADNEVGTIVAETHGLEKLFGTLPKILRDNSFVFEKGMLRDTEEDTRRGYSSQDGVLRVARIRNTIHYVEKHEDDLVWLADACAYGLKRYFSNIQFGDQFCRAMCSGKLLNRQDFLGPCSGFTIYGDQAIQPSPAEMLAKIISELQFRSKENPSS